MPVSVALRRLKPSLALAAVDFFPLPTPTTAAPPVVAEAFVLRTVLRVGDYEVGETYCPRLCGHPGIRY